MNLIDRNFLTAKLEITEECSECKWVDGPCCKRSKTFVDACQAIFEAPVIEQPEIILCKDCKRHNIGIGDFWEEENGNRHWYLKEETCPLIAYRGKAKGHEFDYQYCCCGKEKDDGANINA